MAAILNNADQVVFSNEHSASYGSIIPGTGEVNHQWSKGWAFERAFGGPGYAANPHGLGVVDGFTGRRLPNLARPRPAT